MAEQECVYTDNVLLYLVADNDNLAMQLLVIDQRKEGKAKLCNCHVSSCNEHQKGLDALSCC